LTLLALTAADTPAGSEGTPGPVVLESVVVTLIEQVEVPAQEAGLLAKVVVREGQKVNPGDLLAQIDDTEARLKLKRAEIELETARKQAENRIQVRFAEKAREVAAAELQRATDSMERYPKSISATEIDRLRLAAQKAALAVEQASFDFEVAQFAAKLRAAELESATYDVQRRQIAAPLLGVVVEVTRRQGEWVENNKTVFRILRLDRLRAEGFLHVRDAGEDLVGRSVVLRTTLPGGTPAEFAGKLTFVSPEVSPVNGQMRVWAEIENPDLKLRPGLRGSLTILPDAK
jgi:macrolide-specific efflux system membrane fusion protein